MPVTNISPDEWNTTNQTSKSRSLPYPSPYFDLSQTYFPGSVKELFRFCTYFYNTNCIVPAVVNKLASYPITELIFTASEDKDLQNKWRYLFVDQLNLTFELYQIGIDMGVYGNSFIGVYFPFKRYLKCPHCNSVSSFKSVKDLKVTHKKLDMNGTCPSCKKLVTFAIKDKYIRNVKRVKILRYDPMAIDIIADPVSGHKTYIWDPPTAYKDGIRKGDDLELLERAPKVVLDAIKEDKKIILSTDTMYHMKRPSLSGQSASWGFPLIMHALKSLYYLQVLKRAQEAIASQHIVPLWALYPQAANGSTLPPAAVIGLARWKTQIEDELAKWRKDPNHIPIFNFPVGFERMGGEGRALLLAPEIQQEIQQIVASMSVPQEFVFGGLTWTGSSITLRMLENTFQGTRDGMQRLIKFLISLFAKYFKYKPIDIYMSELKMADDIQRQQIAMNLEAAGKISETRLLSELGYDHVEEKRLKQEEFAAKLSAFIRDSVLQARAQGEAGLVSLDYQIQSQKKQIEAEGDMMLSQAKSQTEAQNKMMELGLIPPMMAPAEGEEGAPAEGEEQQPQQAPPNENVQYADPSMQQQDPYASNPMKDEVTGLPIDPQWGLPVDPETGFLIDLQTGTAINPNDGSRVDLSTGQMISAEEFEAMSMQGTSLVPEQSAGSGTSLQAKTGSSKVVPVVNEKFDPRHTKTAVTKDRARQEEEAKAGIHTSTMPAHVKGLVTRFANELNSMDVVSRRNLLAQMKQDQPTVAMLVKQRLNELNNIETAIKQPKQPKVELPPTIKPTTGDNK